MENRFIILTVIPESNIQLELDQKQNTGKHACLLKVKYISTENKICHVIKIPVCHF